MMSSPRISETPERPGPQQPAIPVSRRPTATQAKEDPLRVRLLATTALARVSLAGALLDAGHVTLAEREVRIALHQNPESAQGHLVLALIEMHHARSAEARERLELSVRLERSNVTAWMALAQVRRQCNDLEAALPAVDNALRFCKETRERVSALVLRGDILLELNQGAAAGSCFHQALTLGPDCEGAHRGMAQVAAEQGNWAAAKAHAERAVRLTTANASARQILGNSYFESGDFGSALWQFTLSLVSCSDGYQRAAARNKEQGYLEEAVALLRLSMLFHPREVATYLELARLYARLDRGAEARALCEAALRLHPQHEEVRTLLQELQEEPATP